jgi:hypothetical protein
MRIFQNMVRISLVIVVVSSWGFLVPKGHVANPKALPDSVWCIRRVDNDSTRRLVTYEVKAPNKWRKMTKQLNPAEAYIIQLDNEIGLIWGDQLWYFGDVDRLSEKEAGEMIRILVERIDKNILISTNLSKKIFTREDVNRLILE